LAQKCRGRHSSSTFSQLTCASERTVDSINNAPLCLSLLACYIEIDGEDDEGCVADDYEPSASRWSDLPDLLLEEIFARLSIKDRYYASLVCQNWYRAFYLKRVWENFLVEDDTLCRRKFNYYSGWQYVLDHMRTQNCFTRVGCYIKGLEFTPTHNFNNMYQFMTLLTFNIQQSRRPDCESEYCEVGKHITSLKYIFPCNMAMRETDDVKLFGTGGQLLKTLKCLLFELDKLKSLRLIDLMLERYEAKHLLDEVLESCNLVLKELCLVNITNTHCPIMHAGLFFNLNVLIISPQNLDDDVLQLLASTKLKHLHIFQNSYSPTTPAACSAKAWKALRKENPKIQVHLRIESSTNADMTFQPSAPVFSVTYRTPKSRITSERVIQIVDMYKFTLTTFGHELLPKYICPRAFDNRIDSLLVLMARQCPNLTSLTVREKASTSTLLLLAKSAINLRFFNVRRNAIVQKCDWPKNPDWTDEFYEWLRSSSRSYESTEREISQILGYNWNMLSDKSFKKIKIHLSGFSI
jgi:F-box protein 39